MNSRKKSPKTKNNTFPTYTLIIIVAVIAVIGLFLWQAYRESSQKKVLPQATPLIDLLRNPEYRTSVFTPEY